MELLKRSIRRCSILFFLLLVLGYQGATAQTDTVDVRRDSGRIINAASDTVTIQPVQRNSPRRALMLSAILPGAGQAYNKRYWKIPIIYVGAGVLGYFIQWNNKNYIKWRDAYIALDKYNEFILDREQYAGFLTRSREDQLNALRNQRDYNRRNFEFCIILSGVLYALNIIDANVDAHLKNFQLGDDNLSLVPSSPADQPGVGLSLRLTLK